MTPLDFFAFLVVGFIFYTLIYLGTVRFQRENRPPCDRCGHSLKAGEEGVCGSCRVRLGRSR